MFDWVKATFSWFLRLFRSDGDRKDAARQVVGMTMLHLLVGTLALAGYSYASDTASFFTGFSGAVLVSAAAYISGSLLGFLFGIPKTPEGAVAPAPQAAGLGGQPAAPQPLLKSNTNLEQVSDWLTKILVGAGLIQLSKFPDFLRDIATPLQDALGAALGVVIAILIYYFLVGFLSAYLMTRLHLQQMLELAGQMDDPDAEKRLRAARGIAIDMEGGTTLDMKENDAVSWLIGIPLNAVKTVSDMLAWAKAQIAAGNFPQARDAANRILELDANQPEAKQLLAKISLRTGQYSEARRALESLGSGAALPLQERRNIKEGLMLTALYESQPAGFEKALQIAGEIKAEFGGLGFSPRGWLYYAAAEGQRHAYLEKQIAKGGALDAEAKAKLQADLKDAFDEALRAAGRALKSEDPEIARDLRILWDPAVGPATENDLYSLHDKPEFQELFRRYAFLMPGGN